MKFLIVLIVVSLNLSAFGAPDCQAPESVTKLAKLLETTFDGSPITCEDGNAFSSKFTFECKGTKYYTVKDPNDLTTLKDGTKAYVISVLSEENGRTKLTEQRYPNAAAYLKNEAPTKVSPTNFVSFSDQSFAFYSDQQPEGEAWLLSVWFIAKGETKARGYKLFAHEAVSCSSK